MSTATERSSPPLPEGATCEGEAPRFAGEQPELQPVLSQRYALELKHLLVTLWFGLFLMHHSYTPLFHSDIWGHVAYGNWILDQRALPAEDPFVQLAEGVPVVCTAWLGQVLFALAGRTGGPEWYSHLFALLALGTALLLVRTFFLQSRSFSLAALGAVLVLLVGWSRHAIIRPENFGSLCFAALLLLIVRADPDRERRGSAFAANASLSHNRGLWLGAPLICGLWANLHGSFIVAFAALGCYVAGRAVEVLWQTRDPLSLLSDRLFRRWLLVAELALAATCINPYGADLLIHTVLFPGNPNLNDVMEWFRLEMVSLEGISVGFSWALLLAVLRHSRARVAPADVLLLAVFSLATCLRVRMVAWYAPVVIVVLMPHLRNIAERLRQTDWPRPLRNAAPYCSQRSFRYTLVCGLAAWLCFAFSPISNPILGGKPRDDKQLYSKETPLGATRYLREHPPQGLVLGHQVWGDWLVWAGPPDLEVVMTTNAVHVAPQQLWNDYLRMAASESSLFTLLSRYRVNTIVASKTLQEPLVQTMRRATSFEIVYEDDISLIARRKATSPDPAAASSGDAPPETPGEND